MIQRDFLQEWWLLVYDNRGRRCIRYCFLWPWNFPELVWKKPWTETLQKMKVISRNRNRLFWWGHQVPVLSECPKEIRNQMLRKSDESWHELNHTWLFLCTESPGWLPLTWFWELAVCAKAAWISLWGDLEWSNLNVHRVQWKSFRTWLAWRDPRFFALCVVHKAQCLSGARKQERSF